MRTMPGGQKKNNLPFGVTRETGTFCCLFFCYLSVIPFLFVWFYHIFPTTVLSIIVCFALCSFIPIAFNQGKTVVTEPVGPLLSASMLACTALVFLGSMYLYWAHVRPMRALILSRECKGVYPQLPAVGFPDAAYVTFAGNTTVDTTKAVSTISLDAGLNTFCVAPIVSAATAGRVEFWAVGVDCCGENGRFECDDVGEAGEKHGYVMQNPTDALFDLVGKYIAPPIMRRDLFLQAIAKAEQPGPAQGEALISSKDAVLVRWTKQTKQELIEGEWLAIMVAIFVNTALSVIMALGLARIVHRFGELRAQNRGEKEQSEQLSVRSRFGDVYDSTVGEHVENVRGIDLTRHMPPPTLKDTVIMGICVPYIIMMLCVLLTTYSGCWTNGHLVYTPFLSICTVAILALLATPGRVVSGLFLMLVMLTGLYIGKVNYTANMFHYCSIEDRRAYSSVPADAKSDVYWDAGIMTFGAKAYLSQNHSVGFLHKGVAYCAAPILSRADDCAKAPPNTTSALLQGLATPPSFLQRTSRMHTSLETDDQIETSLSASQTPVQCKVVAPTRVEFWAIGTDCCGARKDFRCDGGTDANAHSGVLVRATGNEEPGGDRDQFFKAISQSVAAYDLPPPDRPVLMRWGEDPKALQSDWQSTALKMVLLTGLVGFLVHLAIGLGSYWYMKILHKRAEAEREKEVERKRQQSKGNGRLGSSTSLWDGFGLFSQPQELDRNGSPRDQLRV